MAVNRVAYFLAGAALGAAGIALVKSGKGQELLQGVVQSGYGLTETVLAKAETLREDIEDYMAEARWLKEQKAKEEAEAAQAAAAAGAAMAAAGEPDDVSAAMAGEMVGKAAKAKPAARTGAASAAGTKKVAKKPTAKKNATKKNATKKAAAKKPAAPKAGGSGE